MPLPELAQRLLDTATYFILTTINPDGSPQASVIWAKRDGDVVVFSTIRGRRKTRNMQRDPRISLCGYDPAEPLLYVEFRGAVTITTDGGPDLIQELSWKYDHQAFTESSPANVRVVCRFEPTRVVVG
jgi:PPOX class probable F420-dependent enzyme